MIGEVAYSDVKFIASNVANSIPLYYHALKSKDIVLFNNVSGTVTILRNCGTNQCFGCFC